MEDTKVEQKTKNGLDLKTLILIGTVLVSSTLYIHTTFATNHRVTKLEESTASRFSDVEKKVGNQEKISCKIAIAVGVDRSELPSLCQLDIK